MKILIFNWRDITSPLAGGAEVYLHQIASRLARNHEVVFYCGRYRACRQSEEIDGIKIIRQGGSFSVYLRAFFDYIFKLRNENFDVIVDDINGVPFSTPLFVRKPKVAIIHHLVKKEIFFKELPFPLAIIRWIAERMIPFVYCRTPIITVSHSSKAELIEFGISEHQIRIIHNAIDDTMKHLGQDMTIEKPQEPLVVYLGRVKEYKQLDHLLKAFALVTPKVPQAELAIAGRGDYAELERLVKELGLGQSVRLIGEVSEEEKINLLSRAWVFVTASMKEGWGVSVIEANACGTPAIAYNVPGLRDSIRDGKTGLLVAPGDIGGLARAIVSVLSDSEFRKRLSLGAVSWALTFDWDRSAEEFEGVLKGL